MANSQSVHSFFTGPGIKFFLRHVLQYARVAFYTCHKSIAFDHSSQFLKPNLTVAHTDAKARNINHRFSIACLATCASSCPSPPTLSASFSLCYFLTQLFNPHQRLLLSNLQGLGIDFFHCMSCNACMSLSLSSHTCREKGLESNCPICHDFLFTSNTPVKALPCGHFMHSLCYQVCFLLIGPPVVSIFALLCCFLGVFTF
jgi:hypothetical protein